MESRQASTYAGFSGLRYKMRCFYRNRVITFDALCCLLNEEERFFSKRLAREIDPKTKRFVGKYDKRTKEYRSAA